MNSVVTFSSKTFTVKYNIYDDCTMYVILYYIYILYKNSTQQNSLYEVYQGEKHCEVQRRIFHEVGPCGGSISGSIDIRPLSV